ncbi:MAG: hypothetical protein J6K91_06005 [Opitutales bacterium]|nr:hypothetical protein [Opitutales bacterium]MBP3358449.1 hypothetical protein [Opitutales bacterium]
MKQPKNPVETRARKVLQMANELDALLEEKTKRLLKTKKLLTKFEYDSLEKSYDDKIGKLLWRIKMEP